MERGKVGSSLHRSTMRAPYATGLWAGAGTRSIWPNSASASRPSCLYGSGSPAARHVDVCMSLLAGMVLPGGRICG
jgi:hypothetical protein